MRKKIESKNPCLLVFIVDQSRSMREQIGGSPLAKMDALAHAVNDYLYKLARFKCRVASGDGYAIRPRFHVALIGYSGDRVYSAFQGPLAGRSTVPLDELAANPLEVASQKIIEDGIEETSLAPVWLRATAEGNTPMHIALEHASQVVRQWLADWPAVTNPPIVLNVTDGQFNAGPDPTAAAQAITNIQASAERVLLFNLHLSEGVGDALFCPESLPAASDEWARLLFALSSELTEQMQALAREKGYDVAAHARGFAFNADFAGVFDFLDISTEILDREQRALPASVD
jgi:hypothetical protein